MLPGSIDLVGLLSSKVCGLSLIGVNVDSR